MAVLYDRLSSHIERRLPWDALGISESLDWIDLELPDEFHRAIVEGRDYPGIPWR